MAKVDKKGNLEKPELGGDDSYYKIKASSGALPLQTQSLGDLRGDGLLDRGAHAHGPQLASSASRSRMPTVPSELFAIFSSATRAVGKPA